MLIKFTCPAVAYDCDNEPIEETDVLKSLDGLCDTEADIADYLGFPLDQLGLIDDGICFSFDDGPKTLFAAVRFRCIDGLEETQLMKLRDAVAGQLSDGYGEEGFAVSGHERVRSIGYVVERVDEAWALVAEQIDDGAAVPDIRPHPLLRAAEEGDLERVRELLRGVKRDAMPLSRFGASPLTLAAGAGQTEVVRELLNAGFASLDATGAMRHAAQRGDMEMLSLLLDHGAPPDGSPADATAGVPGRHEELHAAHVGRQQAEAGRSEAPRRTRRRPEPADRSREHAADVRPVR